MINRILIRIKVVQLLYSYLISEKDFNIESQPSAPTKEKRFAYGLYLDLLMLMVEVSRSVEKRGGQHPLYDSRFIRGIVSDDKMRSLTNRYRMEDFPFKSCVSELADTVKDSNIYKNFLKKSESGESNADVDVWKDLFAKIIMTNRKVQTAIADRSGYTLGGRERAVEMVEDTFSNFYSSHGHLPAALGSLAKSLEAARELYFRLLALPIAITDLRDRQLDENRHKYLPTDEDRYPNLQFVENRLVADLRADRMLGDYLKSKKIDWLTEDPILITSLLKAVLASGTYKEYMELPATDYHTDVDLWRNIFKQIIFDNEDFLAEMEGKSVFWNDDFEIIGTFLLKTFKRFEERRDDASEIEEPVLPMFKDEEDARFGAELLRATIENKEEYRELINSFVDDKSWDTERLAFMDVVILLTAIAELENFPKIPATVTVNEYIELAKSYSGPKSATFVHGLLASIITKLREDGKIIKPN